MHGFQVLPEFFLERDFVGGRAFYIFGWKPEKESPWSLGLSLGADRGSIEEAGATGGRFGDRKGTTRGDAGGGESGRLLGVWRPYTSANLFYTFSQSLAAGIETDIFASSRLGEYVVLPNFTWRPTQHFFLQAGAGYYQIGSEGQATFVCRANILFPSSRKPRPITSDETGGGEGGGCAPAESGRRGLCRWLLGR